MKLPIRSLSAAGVALAAAATLSAADFHDWAPTPPMGWNSFDCFGLSLTEAQAKEQAEAMVKQLKPFGWNVFVIDHQWYNDNQKGFQSDIRHTFAMDEYGRFIPAPERFPSSKDGKGLKPLADYMHERGLKIGVHLMRGIPRQAVRENTKVKGTNYRAQDIVNMRSTCPWNQDMYGVDMSKPGAQEYYDSVFEQFAEWGLDFIKIDDLSRPYATAEIEGIRKAIDKCGRPIILSLSPGDTPIQNGEHADRHANMWRVSDDFWDRWEPLRGMFGRLHRWEPYRIKGSWPDADMLPFGIIEFTRPTNFTHDEQRLCFTLWSIARSPLILGADMTKLDDWTLKLLTNKEVIEINQNSENNRQLIQDGDLIVWTADVPGSRDKYLAFFNTGTSEYNKYDRRKALAESPGVGLQGVPEAEITADIKGSKILALAVVDNGYGSSYSHSAWIQPEISGPAGTKKLVDMQWSSAHAGWGAVRNGLTSDGQAIDGIGTHALSLIVYKLPEGYDTFKSKVKLVDNSDSRNRLKFLVLDEKAFEQPSPETSDIKVDLAELGFSGKVAVRDLWEGKEVGTAEGAFTCEKLPCHATKLYRLSPAK